MAECAAFLLRARPVSTSTAPVHAPLRREVRALVGIAWPLVVNNLLTIGMQAADTVMAGRLGPDDLAAVAIGGAVWMPLMLFGTGVLTVVSAYTAQLAGAGRYGEIGAVVRQGLWLALALGTTLTAVLHALDALPGWLGLEPPVAARTRGYLEAIAWGGVGILAYQTLRFASEGLAHTRPIMLIGMIGFAVNIAGNYVLMYGALGAPALGAVGCGWASAITMWAMAAVMAFTLARGRAYRRIAVFVRCERPRPATLAELARIGVPAGVAIFLEAALFGSAALLMGWMGTIAVAAHQIAINYAALMFMVPLGLAFGTTVRVGHARGRGDLAAARRAGFAGIGVAVGFMLLSASVMLLGGRYIVGLYTADPAVAQVARSLLLVAAAFQVFDGAQVGAAGALRGLKDTRVPMVITLAAYWGLGFPTAWLLGIRLDLGPQAIWLGLVAGLAAAALLLGLRFAAITRGARDRSSPAGGGAAGFVRPAAMKEASTAE